MKKYLGRPKLHLAILAACLVAGVVLPWISITNDSTMSGDARVGFNVIGAGCLIWLIIDACIYWGRFDRRLLREATGWRNLGKFRNTMRVIPGYRFVDLYRACERLIEAHDGEHHEFSSQMPLCTICGGGAPRRATKPLKSKFAIGPDEHAWFLDDGFWTLKLGDGASKAHDTIVRLRVAHDEYRGTSIILETASCEVAPEDLLDELTADALKHSIYRGQVVRVQTGEGLDDDLGTEANNNELRLRFANEPAVNDEDIVLDDAIREILHRNVFRFHALRERLSEYGVPQRRGLLLFGPPGTGKTYACRYMYSQLEDVTALVVTGQSMLRLKSVCELARMLQPSLLVLEDVDLVFSEREINPHSTSLGDMLDELDGFQSDDAVIAVLTTNAIDRVERAIKDRPGRISQCVFMAPPNAELRTEYLRRFLRDFDATGVDLEVVVRETQGASQAFLKEMVFRAIQIAVERTPEGNGQLVLSTEDFTTAVHEMSSQTEKAAKSIIGLLR